MSAESSTTEPEEVSENTAAAAATESHEPLRVLSVVSTIDLEEGMGCTPAWWQFHKAMHECGHELIVTPYLGRAVESPWWRTYENPCYWESRLYRAVSDRMGLVAGSSGGSDRLVKLLTNGWTKPKWERHLQAVIEEEMPDIVLFFNVPLNQITGLPTTLRREFGIPMVYFDGDMPTILPKYVQSRGFRFNYYDGAELGEFDAFVTNSEGVEESLREMGAPEVHAVHYGADPGVYAPAPVETRYDVAFFGSGASFREEHTRAMVTTPSNRLSSADFVVGGRGFEIDLGPVDRAGWVPVNGFREFCGSARINLNITREGHRTVYKSSTSRPFELAAMGCCVVSDPYDGLGEWFELGEELYVVEDAEEATALYEWLLDDDELRQETGRKARQRVLDEHTFAHRATQLTEILHEQG